MANPYAATNSMAQIINGNYRLQVLSAREKEVLIALVKGLSSKEIADKFFLSPYTVMSHWRNISRKLGIHSVGGLTIYALANKLIDLG